MKIQNSILALWIGKHITCFWLRACAGYLFIQFIFAGYHTTDYYRYGMYMYASLWGADFIDAVTFKICTKLHVKALLESVE